MYSDKMITLSSYVHFLPTLFSLLTLIPVSHTKFTTTSEDFNLIEATFPTRCHVCRFLVEEIYIYMNTSQSHDVVQTGSEFQQSLKKIEYNKSELRLIEAIEEACQKMLEYKVHKDRPIRYARGESNTFKTLYGLRKRGVKVELGFPYEMWDHPDREVQDLKQKCEQLVEDYEGDLSKWYYNHQDKNLTQWLCAEKVLGKHEQDCLDISPFDYFPDIKKAEEESRINMAKEAQRKEIEGFSGPEESDIPEVGRLSKSTIKTIDKSAKNRLQDPERDSDERFRTEL